METEQLLKQIEELRNKLYNLAEEKYLVDHEVVDVSQELDQLLNEFYRREDSNSFRKVG
jgi:chaperonin cofactor prefoldin